MQKNIVCAFAMNFTFVLNLLHAFNIDDRNLWIILLIVHFTQYCAWRFARSIDLQLFIFRNFRDDVFCIHIAFGF